MKIIGLTGFAKSGKSTAAEILKEMGGVEVAFAKHLKDVCAVVFNIPRSHFDDQKYKEIEFNNPIRLRPTDIADILDYFEVPKRLQPAVMLAHHVYLKSPRHVAQYIGTEVLRSIDKDIHIKMAFKLASSSNALFLICSDMRFDNELKYVENTDGLTIGISRKAVFPTNLENLHPSEKEIPNLISRSDVVIENEGTIESFQEEIKTNAWMYLERETPLGPQ